MYVYGMSVVCGSFFLRFSWIFGVSQIIWYCLFSFHYTLFY